LSFAGSGAEKRFYNLRKFHLNNSVQDSTYLSELFCLEMFRVAGVPAPRVTHAWVTLNGRTLGLYTLVESFDREFLSGYFAKPRGNLYGQPEPGDVTEPLARAQGDGELTRSDLKALVAAAQETDPGRRWARLHQVLDVDRFLSFMAVEVLLCHWDGYTFGAHNYRVYHDLDTGRMVFFPHDLDQVLGDPNAPIVPNPNGLMSQAILGTPEGRRLYRERFGSVFTNVFRATDLSNRIDAVATELVPKLKRYDPNLAERFKSEAGSLQDRIVQRHAALQELLQRPEPKPLSFDNGVAHLANAWTRNHQGSLELEQVEAGQKSLLWIKCNGEGGVGSWRQPVLLEPGKYRFVGRVKATGLRPRRDGPGTGGGLRISGQQRQNQIANTSEWTELVYDFTVDNAAREVVLVCELRADAGEIWFDLTSLRLSRSQ
jgi:spore coat protein H